MPLVVTAHAVGSHRPLFADWSVPLPPHDDGTEGGMTLRDLIEKIVRAELTAYEQRREARRLDRVLTRSQIDDAARRGGVRPESREVPAAPSAEEAVDDALQAFEDKLYLVVIDGREARDLDEQVYVTVDTRVTFIRLVFLAGA